MADLSDKEAAQTIKIAGSDASGLETNFVKASDNGDLSTSDIINVAAQNRVMTITTSPVEALGAGVGLSSRKLLVIQAQTANIKYGFTVGSQPFTLANGASLYLSVGPDIHVYLVRTTGSGPVAVAELS